MKAAYKFADETQKEYRQRARACALRAYGGTPPCCGCCGETEECFLELDHVNGDGAEHRRALLGRPHSGGLWSKLRKLGFPNDPPIRVLCANCHTAIKPGESHCKVHITRIKKG